MRKKTVKSPLERGLLRAVSVRLDTVEGLVWRKRHGSAFQVAGDPDVYFLWRGRHVEIELKRPGEEPTALQLHRLAEWKKGGAVTAVVHTIHELEVLLKMIMI